MLASSGEGLGTIEAICINIDGIPEVHIGGIRGNGVTLDGGGDGGIGGVDWGYTTKCEIAKVGVFGGVFLCGEGSSVQSDAEV